jgi:TetR/AcrR family transcriptional repressor of nem operon
VEVLETYWAALEKAYAPILRDPKRRPTDRVLTFFHALSDEHQRENYTLGCLLGTLALELSSSSLDVRSKVAGLLERWVALLTACLSEAQTIGELGSDIEARELAAILIEAWEGAALRGKVLRNESPYRWFETVLVNKTPSSSPQFDIETSQATGRPFVIENRRCQ